MPVNVSRRQIGLLLLLFLLLLWPTASLISGWQWGLFLPCWFAGLWLAWRNARLTAGELIWDGQWLEWRGERYQLGPGSRILPGAIWLELLAGPHSGFRLWLFTDALAPQHYRSLARAVHLAPPPR